MATPTDIDATAHRLSQAIIDLVKDHPSGVVERAIAEVLAHLALSSPDDRGRVLFVIGDIVNEVITNAEPDTE
jgi:hypothetical protein